MEMFSILATDTYSLESMFEYLLRDKEIHLILSFTATGISTVQTMARVSNDESRVLCCCRFMLSSHYFRIGLDFNFGDASLSCNAVRAQTQRTRTNSTLSKMVTYYGHPNRLRGQTDSRQCVYRNFDDPQGNTPAIKKLESSSNGIAEFQTAHFGGQLRGQLIIGRYKGALYHVKLSSDGKGALFRESIPPKLVSSNDGGLDVVQGPDGSLFVAQNDAGSVIYHKPNEPSTSLLKVLSVFPRRGHIDGGTTLSIFGLKFGSSASNLSVTVGGLGCPIISAKDTKITCTLPAGLGKADVMVTNSQALESDTLNGGLPLHHRSDVASQ